MLPLESDLPTTCMYQYYFQAYDINLFYFLQFELDVDEVLDISCGPQGLAMLTNIVNVCQQKLISLL